MTAQLIGADFCADSEVAGEAVSVLARGFLGALYP